MSSSRIPASPRLPITGRSPKAAGPVTVALPAVVTRRSMQRMIVHVTTLDQSLIDRLWNNPDEVIASAAMLKNGDRCTVTHLDLPCESIGAAAATNDPTVAASSGSFTLKRYNLKSSLHTAIHMPLRSRAQWSWLNGRRLIKAGLPTPMPLACLEERRHGLLHLRSYLLSQFVPGRSLLDLVHSGDARGERLADLARQFLRLWQTLGQLQAGHGDMKASNFIVDSQGKLWLIDLDGLRIHHTTVLLRRERRNDLVRFMRNWKEHPEAAAVFRARIGTG